MSVSILNQPAFLPQLYLVRHLATVIRYAPVHHHQSPTSAFLLQEYLGACLPHGAVVSYAGILTTLYLVCHRQQRLSGKVCYRILHIIYSRRILWDINIQKKKPRIFPPRCFLLASSWSMMPPEVVRTTKPNCLEGRRLFVHFSMSPMATSNLGEITPHLLRRPVRLTITLPARWSSTTLNIKNIK